MIKDIARCKHHHNQLIQPPALLLHHCTLFQANIINVAAPEALDDLPAPIAQAAQPNVYTLVDYVACSKSERDWLEDAGMQRRVVDELVKAGYKQRPDLLAYHHMPSLRAELNLLALDRAKLGHIVQVYAAWHNQKLGGGWFMEPSFKQMWEIVLEAPINGRLVIPLLLEGTQQSSEGIKHI